ncbi:DUF502 domain-containing protein [Afifella marina]|uniref:Uncharacterized membrane protein n=1 Tax=Afifella marina DSM 2698 TaxID=1120955 RepID=A0A1G5NH88_AFIMA|nr:DUF502 domain-containing protein [Afifella marina]MBK1623458.1 DUF502 domain-containing protein [Afifella marina DSM 2698]MBK1626451.1 DUF502 domain-containing protein [Afifella marina]MBK5916000.1 hypothetical protein [Afifella marina]RAI18389.1 hypothetical protein CH311_15775 [Afifella marina DSM 2698]SCZ36534.1 Uncharacterized membrane protein [Afifella marina DSM 2698]
METEDAERGAKPQRRHSKAGLRLRNYFLTGIVVAAPIGITFYLTWAFVAWVDGWVKPLIPHAYNPDNYLPFSVPGFGLIVAIFLLTMLGFLTANLVGRTIVAYGELLLDRMPLVRNLYRALKQIFETALSQSSRSFQQVGLIEYPRRGLWALVFIATDTKGEIADRLKESDTDTMAVFLPTTPNPTSGFLLIVPRQDVILLDMTVEEGAKLVISAGLVAPEYQRKTKALAREAKEAADDEREAAE